MRKRTTVVIIIGIAFALVTGVATAARNRAQVVVMRQARAGLVHVAASGCRRGRLPDRRCTPGATFNVGAAQVCVSGYSQRVRNVPASEKRQVYAEYGIRTHSSGQYEVDHLIPLELGGSNSIRNLCLRLPTRDRDSTRRTGWRTSCTDSYATGACRCARPNR
jgi:hypothetical protein